MGLGLVGGVTGSSVYDTLDQLMAKRLAEQQYADKLKQQDIENRQNQQRIDLQGQNAQAQQARWTMEDARSAQAATQAQGNQLVDELSPGQSISDDTGKRLDQSGRSDLHHKNADYAYPGFLQSGPVARDVNPGEQAGRIFTGTNAQQAGVRKEEQARQAADDARANPLWKQEYDYKREHPMPTTGDQGHLWVMRGGKPFRVSESGVQPGDEPMSATKTGATGKQKTDLAFYNRMADAIKILDDLEPHLSDTDIAMIHAAPQTGLMSYVRKGMSDTAKRYAQALKQYTEARLRKESGAAIPTDEYDQDRAAVARNFGDSEAGISQRKAYRNKTAEGVAFASGPAYEEYYGSPFTPLDKRPTGGGGAGGGGGQPPAAPAGWKYVPKPGGGWTAVEAK